MELTRQGQYSEARKVLQDFPAPDSVPQRIAFYRLFYRLKAAIASGLREPHIASSEMEQALALAPGDSDLLMAVALANSQVIFQR